MNYLIYKNDVDDKLLDLINDLKSQLSDDNYYPDWVVKDKSALIIYESLISLNFTHRRIHDSLHIELMNKLIKTNI